MKTATQNLRIQRHFTVGFESVEGKSPFEMLEWELRDASIVAADSTQIFSAPNVEFPRSWSQTAVNIVAQKYFRQQETSLKEMVGRVVTTLKNQGIEAGYFNPAEAEIFADELTYILISQRAAFNSPVWFNIGVKGASQQSSACFILSVEDSLDSILNWIAEEGIIFKGGSGAGVNLSSIRSSKEALSGGGQASGPVSFMRGADASAGAIRSGGTTRRAAKMVVLDVDHPDIMEFVWCKALEERKSRALKEAGFNMGVDGIDIHSVQYQNANNSVRLSDEFFKAVENDADWNLIARNSSSTGSPEISAGSPEIMEIIKARELLDAIAQASWECADPGVQYDTTINRWHTTPNAGRISASNPCSEYFHLDNSACNLASLNLLSFYDVDTETFDVNGFCHAVSIITLAQDILVGFSDYPTEKIKRTSRSYRQLGLGYTNLGALLMSCGIPYDSDLARSIAGSITALMTGRAYLASAELASYMGAFSGYKNDRENMLRVLNEHKKAFGAINMNFSEARHALTPAATLTPAAICQSAASIWDRVLKFAEIYGVRNSQVSVLAPTGTISFMMDCDTTGIEPDLALVKNKQLVGGGSITITNNSVENGLRTLGYGQPAIQKILNYVSEKGSIVGAPGFDVSHADVFACAVGDNPISSMGHLKMMAAVQPFISGGISKTVNLPSSATPENIADLYIKGHSMGLKALAIYRDNSKTSQPLSIKSEEAKSAEAPESAEPKRKQLPRLRSSKTFEFKMPGSKGYVTVGEYRDGKPGEIFIKVSKQGSTLAGVMDAFAIAVSHGLQYGVPLGSYIKAFKGMRFEPMGITDDEEIRMASSIIDYIFKRLALMYLPAEERAELNIYTSAEKEENISGIDSDAPLCGSCGHYMFRSGSCYTCGTCGATSGCG